MPHPCDRRNFLHTTAASLLAAPLAATHATAAEPLPPAIDVHTHFYDPTRPQGVPWPNPKDKTLYRPVLPADFRKTVAGLNVGGTVAVEASPWLEDNQWLLDLAARDPIIVGVVGHLDVRQDEFAKQLRRFGKNPLFRGIRIGAAEVRLALEQKPVRDRLGWLAERGLSLDVNGGPDLPADVARLAKQLPNLRIIINHAGNVRIDGQPPPQDWRKGMSAAAAEKRVVCKVSALVEATRKMQGDAPGDVNFYRPELDALWNIFGEERLLYGSDWPVSERAAPYARTIGIVRGYLQSASRERQVRFFTQNAQTAYQLPAKKS
ncbi:MAG: amidohydrolase family protein [Bacteroidales bacterium]|nr:amidohydrolase family protein [Bacteroidales bacterium]